MAHHRLINIMQKNNLSHFNFTHFDYVETFEQLPQLQLLNHPRKKKLVQQFAAKCLQKIEEDQKVEQNKQKVNNFLQRMTAYEQLRKQKLQALRFLDEKYDSRCRQLKFYPKVNTHKTTQKGRYWKDIDGDQKIQREESIHAPNLSRVEEHSLYSSVSQ